MNIPDVIKIGDTEFSVKDTPALLELIQTARKEEKDKLYSQIQNLESAKRVLEDEKKNSGKLTAEKEEQLVALRNELETAKSEKVKLEEELKEFETGKGKSKEDAMKDTLTKDDVKSMIAEMLKETAKEVSGKVDEVKKELTAKEIADFRKELLEKNKGLIIEKFVPDNLDTKEAVTKAVEDALAESKNYIIKEYEIGGGKKQKMTLAEYEAFDKEAKEKEELEKARRTQHYSPGEQFPNPPGGFSGDLTDKDLLSKLDSMSDAEYAKHADEILREARSLKYTPEEQ